MSETTATRTLVKSPPELWAECSDASSLGRHLPQFGEIKITKLDPETSVAWEGERVSGTVRIEPSGWGTKVTFTAMAEPAEAEPVARAEPVVEPAVTPEPVVAVEPEVVPEPESPAPLSPPAPSGGLFARLMGRLGFRRAPAPGTPAGTETTPPIEPESPPVSTEPEPVAVEPEPEAPAPSAADELAQIEAALSAALDSLGQAHHRPYSRA